MWTHGGYGGHGGCQREPHRFHGWEQSPAGLRKRAAEACGVSLAVFLDGISLLCMRISPLANGQGWGDRIDALGICSRIRAIRGLA